ncbi:uncharacterized protein TNIN_68081 [Trichonephila inaurata madagascariensis]|uniref:Uncharacterized protein n=1 Tax=Trichonephila inaurata madagascariensis TaxID=2747483 RepID=A0A8X7BW36_9ARAC|nr:uncharacterized protein TNIN_68081 [Trichonephila inaurata madagascariensis]
MVEFHNLASKHQPKIQVLRACNPGQQGSCRDRGVKSFTIYDPKEKRKERKRVTAESVPDPWRFERANTNFDPRLSFPPPKCTPFFQRGGGGLLFRQCNEF